jgi:hypothetical protein
VTIPPFRASRRSLLAAALATPFISRRSFATAMPPITDAIGRTITLKAPAERIVLGFNYEEYTAVAGPAGWDRVVGFGKTLWSDWRPSVFKRYLVPIPRLADLPDVGNTDDNSFSLEKVLSLRPDLVIMAEWSFSSLTQQVQQVQQLEALGIPVMVIDYNAEIPERHIASTIAMGIATGNEVRARTLAALYGDKLADNTSWPPIPMRSSSPDPHGRTTPLPSSPASMRTSPRPAPVSHPTRSVRAGRSLRRSAPDSCSRSSMACRARCSTTPRPTTSPNRSSRIASPTSTPSASCGAITSSSCR